MLAQRLGKVTRRLRQFRRAREKIWWGWWGRQEPFVRFVDESQSGFPLRLLEIAMEKVDPAFAAGGPFNETALGKHVLGNQANGQCDQSRNNDQIIQMSEDRDKI